MFGYSYDSIFMGIRHLSEGTENKPSGTENQPSITENACARCQATKNPSDKFIEGIIIIPILCHLANSTWLRLIFLLSLIVKFSKYNMPRWNSLILKMPDIVRLKLNC